MTTAVFLLFDAKGWPEPLDPEVLTAGLEAHLEVPLAAPIQARKVDERWFEAFPTEDSIVFLILTQSSAAGWQLAVKTWLNGTHRLYVLYTDAVAPTQVRELATLTAAQPVARTPYRIAHQTALGIEYAMTWAADILLKAIEAATVFPPVKLSPASWRHLVSKD